MWGTKFTTKRCTIIHKHLWISAFMSPRCDKGAPDEYENTLWAGSNRVATVAEPIFPPTFFYQETGLKKNIGFG